MQDEGAYAPEALAVQALPTPARTLNNSIVQERTAVSENVNKTL